MVLVLFAAFYVLAWCFGMIRFDHAVVVNGVLRSAERSLQHRGLVTGITPQE